MRSYNKSTKTITQSSRKISTDWPGITFDQIDAVFKTSSESIYFFSGTQYIIYDKTNSRVVKEASSIATGFPGLANIPNFETIDAVLNTYKKNIIYIFKGEEYVQYDIANKRVVKDATQTGDDIGAIDKTISAAFYDVNREIIIFHQEASNLQAFLNSGILFKYDGKVEKKFGRTDKVALSFSANYGLLGTIKVPGMSATASTHMDFALFGNTHPILHLDTEIVASMGKSYPQTDRNGDSYHSRAGAKLTATVLNVEIL